MRHGGFRECVNFDFGSFEFAGAIGATAPREAISTLKTYTCQFFARCSYTARSRSSPRPSWQLVPIVSKSLVSFGHAVCFFALANSTACFVSCIHQFVG